MVHERSLMCTVCAEEAGKSHQLVAEFLRFSTNNRFGSLSIVVAAATNPGQQQQFLRGAIVWCVWLRRRRRWAIGTPSFVSLSRIEVCSE